MAGDTRRLGTDGLLGIDGLRAFELYRSGENVGAQEQARNGGHPPPTLVRYIGYVSPIETVRGQYARSRTAVGVSGLAPTRGLRFLSVHRLHRPEVDQDRRGHRVVRGHHLAPGQVLVNHVGDQAERLFTDRVGKLVRAFDAQTVVDRAHLVDVQDRVPALREQRGETFLERVAVDVALGQNAKLPGVGLDRVQVGGGG